MTRSVTLDVLERVDAPGVMLLATDQRGQQTALYLDPRTAMTAVDAVARIAERWTLEAAA